MMPQKRGPDRDFRVLLWGIIFLIVLVTIFFLAADKAVAMKRSDPQADMLTQIASFYAGRPVKIGYRDMPELGSTDFPETGLIWLNPQVRKSISDFFKYKKDKNRGPVLGAIGMVTLLHEAFHNKHFAAVTNDNYQNPDTGFYGSGSERQAAALGTEVLPDMLQRFFGIKIGSPLSNKYLMVAKSLGSYRGIY